MSNYTALRVAIAQKCPYDYYNKGIDSSKPLRIYVSEQNHFCIDKAVASLGIGLENLVKIKVIETFQIDLNDLEERIATDINLGYIPLAVIGNAGTVNSGAVDCITSLNTICKKYNLWLHLDAAYGGFAASTYLRNSVFKGMELADSMAIDLHKWLFVPFECGAVLMKNPMHLKSTFSYIPEYQKFEHDDLKMDFSEYSMQQSRNFKALKVWMNFKVYGANALRESILNSINLMQYLGSLIEASKDFELMTPVGLSVVCFRYIPKDKNLNSSAINQLNLGIIKASEKEGKIFIRETILKDRVIIRACCTNFRRKKENIAYLLEELRDVGERITPQLVR